MLHVAPADDDVRHASDLLLGGRVADARARCLDVLARNPECAEAHHLLGVVAAQQGDLARAIQHLHDAVRLSPSRAAWHRDLGTAACAAGDWPAATAALDACLALTPDDTAALHAIGIARLELGEVAAAAAALKRAGTRAPDDPAILCDLGRALARADRDADAAAALARGLAIDPALARGHETLADLQERRGQYDDALDSCRRLVSLRPESSRAHVRLALACWRVGDLAGCRSALDRAFALGIDAPDARSGALYLLLFDPDWDPVRLRNAYAQTFGGSVVGGAPRRAARAPSRRLRIGYVSGEFRATPAYYFLSPFLSRHDRAAVDVFLYSASPDPDARTGEYRTFGCWRDVAGWTAGEVRTAVAADGIDVLVDLSGHFPHNRLDVLATRAAPVQVTFPNYPFSTGCPQVDYIVSDEWTSPPGTEGEYVERLWRLPTGYLVYRSPAGCPTPGPPPVAATGRVTFGLFQQWGKFTDVVWDAIARILHASGDAELLVHNADPALDRAGSGARTRVMRQLASRGLERTRVRFAGPRPLPEHMTTLAEADLALDTFPYTGQTTTCECLRMGVPVVSRYGRTHPGRVGPALLLRAGLPELVASSLDDYVERAVALARDRARLRRYRARLPRAVTRGPLGDAPAMVRALESAYRRMCRNRP